jgi:hypothetical protein
VIFEAVCVFAMAAKGQATPTQGTAADAKQPHWHKYDNREYGFSFWYPDTYRPLRTSPPGDAEKEARPHNRDLLLLRSFDDPDAAIWINIDVRPFSLRVIAQEYAPRGSEPSTRQPLPKGHRIGDHFFYYYGGFSGGPGNNADNYLVEVNGKTLRIQFDGPYTYPDIPIEVTKKLEPKILKTLRTY